MEVDRQAVRQARQLLRALVAEGEAAGRRRQAPRRRAARARDHHRRRHRHHSGHPRLRSRPPQPRRGARSGARHQRRHRVAPRRRSALARRERVGALRRAARRGGADARGHPRLVPPRPRHALRRRHPPLQERPDELGVHRRALAGAAVARRVRDDDAELRDGVVRARGVDDRRTRRRGRARAADRRRGAAEGGGVKRTLMFAVPVALYFAAVALWVGGDKRVSKHAFDEFSASSTAPKGVSLAAKYLARNGRRVDALTLALNDRNVAQGAVVFRIGPQAQERFRVDFEEMREKKTKAKKRRTTYVTPLPSDEEEAWGRAGGRLVVATEGHYGSLDVGDAPAKMAKKVFPLWPGLDTLDLPAARAGGGEM